MSNEKKSTSLLQGKDMPSTRVEPEVKSVSVKKPQSFFGERPLPAAEIAPRLLRYQTRRDVLVFGACALAASRRWTSPATRYAQSLGCASKHGLSREAVVSKQSIAYRR
jgi:hypothetical protein